MIRKCCVALAWGALVTVGAQAQTAWPDFMPRLQPGVSESPVDFEAFKASGGQGRFLEFQPAPGRDGHMLHVEPSLWTPVVDAYMAEMDRR
ncbi:hypothetical protein [Pseudorhodoferax sp. Leaf267]|uniref:hypothetical protein n=1 Tax=Pseudorhodoferax sp. Leaf267 TaxID=1736316 RepID=UPI0012E23F83|nr:hypothetical protein [Pseudorhodoferax sp. Leaf267]